MQTSPGLNGGWSSVRSSGLDTSGDRVSLYSAADRLRSGLMALKDDAESPNLTSLGQSAILARSTSSSASFASSLSSSSLPPLPPSYSPFLFSSLASPSPLPIAGRPGIIRPHQYPSLSHTPVLTPVPELSTANRVNASLATPLSSFSSAPKLQPSVTSTSPIHRNITGLSSSLTPANPTNSVSMVSPSSQHAVDLSVSSSSLAPSIAGSALAAASKQLNIDERLNNSRSLLLDNTTNHNMSADNTSIHHASFTTTVLNNLSLNNLSLNKSVHLPHTSLLNTSQGRSPSDNSKTSTLLNNGPTKGDIGITRTMPAISATTPATSTTPSPYQPDQSTGFLDISGALNTSTSHFQPSGANLSIQDIRIPTASFFSDEFAKSVGLARSEQPVSSARTSVAINDDNTKPLTLADLTTSGAPTPTTVLTTTRATSNAAPTVSIHTPADPPPFSQPLSASMIRESSHTTNHPNPSLMPPLPKSPLRLRSSTNGIAPTRLTNSTASGPHASTHTPTLVPESPVSVAMARTRLGLDQLPIPAVSLPFTSSSSPSPSLSQSQSQFRSREQRQQQLVTVNDSVGSLSRRDASTTRVDKSEKRDKEEKKLKVRKDVGTNARLSTPPDAVEDRKQMRGVDTTSQTYEGSRSHDDQRNNTSKGANGGSLSENIAYGLLHSSFSSNPLVHDINTSLRIEPQTSSTALSQPSSSQPASTSTTKQGPTSTPAHIQPSTSVPITPSLAPSSSSPMQSTTMPINVLSPLRRNQRPIEGDTSFAVTPLQPEHDRMHENTEENQGLDTTTSSNIRKDLRKASRRAADEGGRSTSRRESRSGSRKRRPRSRESLTLQPLSSSSSLRTSQPSSSSSSSPSLSSRSRLGRGPGQPKGRPGEHSLSELNRSYLENSSVLVDRTTEGLFEQSASTKVAVSDLRKTCDHFKAKAKEYKRRLLVQAKEADATEEQVKAARDAERKLWQNKEEQHQLAASEMATRLAHEQEEVKRLKADIADLTNNLSLVASGTLPLGTSRPIDFGTSLHGTYDTHNDGEQGLNHLGQSTSTSASLTNPSAQKLMSRIAGWIAFLRVVKDKSKTMANRNDGSESVLVPSSLSSSDKGSELLTPDALYVMADEELRRLRQLQDDIEWEYVSGMSQAHGEKAKVEERGRNGIMSSEDENRLKEAMMRQTRRVVLSALLKKQAVIGLGWGWRRWKMIVFAIKEREKIKEVELRLEVAAQEREQTQASLSKQIQERALEAKALGLRVLLQGRSISKVMQLKMAYTVWRSWARHQAEFKTNAIQRLLDRKRQCMLAGGLSLWRSAVVRMMSEEHISEMKVIDAEKNHQAESLAQTSKEIELGWRETVLNRARHVAEGMFRNKRLVNLKTTMRAWRDNVKLNIVNRRLACSTLALFVSKQLKQPFLQWRHAVIHRRQSVVLSTVTKAAHKSAAVMAQRHSQKSQRLVFASWREFVKERRLKMMTVERFLKDASKERARDVFHTWRRRIIEMSATTQRHSLSANLKSALLLSLVAKAKRRVLESAYTKWYRVVTATKHEKEIVLLEEKRRTSLKSHQDARVRHLFSERLKNHTASAFKAWRIYANNKVKALSALSRCVSSQYLRTMRGGLSRWHVISLRIAYRKRLDELSLAKRQSVLSRASQVVAATTVARLGTAFREWRTEVRVARLETQMREQMNVSNTKHKEELDRAQKEMKVKEMALTTEGMREKRETALMRVLRTVSYTKQRSSFALWQKYIYNAQRLELERRMDDLARRTVSKTENMQLLQASLEEKLSQTKEESDEKVRGLKTLLDAERARLESELKRKEEEWRETLKERRERQSVTALKAAELLSTHKRTVAMVRAFKMWRETAKVACVEAARRRESVKLRDERAKQILRLLMMKKGAVAFLEWRQWTRFQKKEKLRQALAVVVHAIETRINQEQLVMRSALCTWRRVVSQGAVTHVANTWREHCDSLSETTETTRQRASFLISNVRARSKISSAFIQWRIYAQALASRKRACARTLLALSWRKLGGSALQIWKNATFRSRIVQSTLEVDKIRHESEETMEALRERIDKERETLVKQFKAAQQEDARIIEQRMQSQLEQEKAALLRIQSEKEAAWEREKAILLADQEERRRASLTMAQALKDTNRDFVLRNIDSARKVDMTRTFAAWRQFTRNSITSRKASQSLLQRVVAAWLMRSQRVAFSTWRSKVVTAAVESESLRWQLKHESVREYLSTVLRRQSISSILRRWNDWASQQRLHKEQLLSHIVGRYSRHMLMNGWMVWKNRTNEMKAEESQAKVHGNVVTMKIKMRTKLIEAQKKNHLLSAFIRWRGNVAAMRITKALSDELGRDAHSLLKENRELKVIVASLQSQNKIRAMEALEHAERKAALYYEKSMMSKVFAGMLALYWRRATARRKVVDVLYKACDRSKREAFDRWRIRTHLYARSVLLSTLNTSQRQQHQQQNHHPVAPRAVATPMLPPSSTMSNTGDEAHGDKKDDVDQNPISINSAARNLIDLLRSAADHGGYSTGFTSVQPIASSSSSSSAALLLEHLLTPNTGGRRPNRNPHSANGDDRDSGSIDSTGNGYPALPSNLSPQVRLHRNHE